MSADIGPAAKDIETAWNNGEYDRALDALGALPAGRDMGAVETTINWAVPLQRSLLKSTAANIRIGVQDSITAVDIVCDSSNQRLFAVLAFHSSAIDGYELVRSTDGGTTWGTVSTNSFDGASGQSVSIAYVKNMVRLIYIISNGTELRWRQFDNNGSPVAFPGGSFYTTLAGPAASPTVKEVKLFSNNLYNNNRLYYATILSDHALNMYWAYADSAHFSPVASTSHALQGLSAVWSAWGNISYFVSYIDTAGNVCIDSVGGTHMGHKRVVPGITSTSLGYYRDTIVCAHGLNNGVGVCEYQISYNGGQSWLSGSVDTATVTHEYPLICMEKGQGMAMIYRYYTPVRQGRVIARQYKGPGVWSSPVAYSAHDPYPIPAAITALGGNTWGIVYACWTAPYVAYFTTYKNTLTGIGEVPGNIPPAYALFQNFPNPFNPATVIRFQIPAASDVRLSVFDVLGREVSVLVNERRGAGVHEVRFDGSNLASGMYFYRLQAGSVVQTKKLLLLR
jgi:hypothetical protein